MNYLLNRSLHKSFDAKISLVLTAGPVSVYPWQIQAACKWAQQCWELLHACWQWCANGCKNFQQVWDLQRIMGRIQPISLCNPCVMSVRGPNNAALRFGDHDHVASVCTWLYEKRPVAS